MSLEIIFRECEKGFGVEKSMPFRKKERVYSRVTFYFLGHKHVTENQSELGRFLNQDHATVNNVFKRMGSYMRKKEFVSRFNKIKSRVDAIFSDEEKQFGSLEEEEIYLLKQEIALKDKEINTLMEMIEKGVPEEIMDMIYLISPEELQSFVKTRVNPFMRLYLADQRRARRLRNYKGYQMPCDN